MTKQFKNSAAVQQPGTEEDGTLISSSARTFSRLVKKEKVRECMRHLRSLVNPVEGLEKISTLTTLENALKALKEANTRQASAARGKKQSQSSGGGTQPSNALNTTSNTQSKSSSEGEEILSFSSAPYTEAKIYSVRLSLSEGEVIVAERALLQVLNYPTDSWSGCLLTNFVFDPDIPRLLTCLYHFAQNRKTLRETASLGAGNKKHEQFCLRFRVNPSLSRGTFAAPSSDRYLPFLVKANYQIVRPVNPAQTRTLAGQTDQTSGRTQITCVSSGIGSETTSCNTMRLTAGAISEDHGFGGMEQLSLSIARIDHFYLEPFFVPKRNRFATRLTARCHLTNVDPAITSLLGFLPQDLEQISVFDLVHTSDLVKIFDAYKEVADRQQGAGGDRWIHVPPVRWRCCNGTHLLIQTNLRSHTEKTSGAVDFIYGLHEIMKGPEKLTRFFDPTVSAHFSRLRLSHQKHSQNPGSSKTAGTEAAPEEEPTAAAAAAAAAAAEGLNHGGGISGHSDTPSASVSWMVDPRRLRLKALFQDVSPTELAAATSLGISIAPSTASEGASVPQEKRFRPLSKDSVDLDYDSTCGPEHRAAASGLGESRAGPRCSGGGSQARHQFCAAADELSEVAVERSLSVTAAARGFSYDAWNHYQHIQRYLASVQREAATADPRGRPPPAQEAVLLSAPGSSMPLPGLPAVGRSLCSSAMVQISDNDPEAQARRWCGDSEVPGVDSAGEGGHGPDQTPAPAPPDRATNALPLTVDNLQRHTRIQEKHYRQQILHQLQRQQVRQRGRLYRLCSKRKAAPAGQGPAQAASGPAPGASQASDVVRDIPAVRPTSGPTTGPASGQVPNVAGVSNGANPQHRYRGSRQTSNVIGAEAGGCSETASSSQAGPKLGLRKRKLPLRSKDSSPSASEERSSVSSGSSTRSDAWRPLRQGLGEGLVDAARLSTGRSRRQRRRYRPPPGPSQPLGVTAPPTARELPPGAQPPTAAHKGTLRQGPAPAPQPQQAPAFHGGPHTGDGCTLGMPPVHFAECYPASREPNRSSRPVTGRRGHRRGHAYSGDHLDLYATATHPVPFYLPGTAAPPPLTSRTGPRDGANRRAHRPMPPSVVPGAVPGAVPATPFPGLWGLPSWGFVPLMPWHSFPGAPVQWPYYPQVGGALPPYLHGGFFGNLQQHHQQQQQQRQAQQQTQQPQQPPAAHAKKSEQKQQTVASQTSLQQQQQQPVTTAAAEAAVRRSETSRVAPWADSSCRGDHGPLPADCLAWGEEVEKKCAVPPLRLVSPQPSVIVTAHTEERASEMLSSPADGASEGASSSFVYLLDSSNGSHSTAQRRRQQQQLQAAEADPQDAVEGRCTESYDAPGPCSPRPPVPGGSEAGGGSAAEGRRATRRSRFGAMPSRGQPFWLEEIGTELSEQTAMRYQIPCPLDRLSSSSTRSSNSGPEPAANASASGRSEGRRQTALWRCRLGKMAQSEKVSAQVMELFQHGCSDDDENGEDAEESEATSGARKCEVELQALQQQVHGLRYSNRHRQRSRRTYGASTRDRSRSMLNRPSASSGLESPSAGRGSCSPWSSSIKESDGVTGSDEGSGLSGVVEFHSDMEPFLDCLFIGSGPPPTALPTPDKALNPGPATGVPAVTEERLSRSATDAVGAPEESNAVLLDRLEESTESSDEGPNSDERDADSLDSVD